MMRYILYIPNGSALSFSLEGILYINIDDYITLYKAAILKRGFKKIGLETVEDVLDIICRGQYFDTFYTRNKLNKCYLNKADFEIIEK